jgi:non-ribosomal peptide synthase protein (TIGR01720 family)
MVPSAYVALERFPVLPNGKVDRNSLPAPEMNQPALRQPYAAPRTRAEEMLAAIWAEVLGIDQVGIHDNFFELGGDSILIIQVISRARQRGLEIAPKQLFEHQTVAALAASLGAAHPVAPERGVVTGVVPLTPIQEWYFEQEPPDAHHFNQGVLLEVQPGFRADLLRPLMQLLLQHHDALRLRFQRDTAWTQVNVKIETHDVVEIIDLSALSPSQRPGAVKRKADGLQRSLDLEEGPLLRVAYFDFGSGQPGRLLAVIHHLVVDPVSWRILLEDLVSVYSALVRGEAPVLPPKTTSFKDWAERLRGHARSDRTLSQLAYWTRLAEEPIATIPVDHPGGQNLVQSARELTVALTEEETRELLQEVPRAYRTQIDDVLLTALGLTLTRWTESERVLVDLERHGREPLFQDVDLSRTVGWFTSLFPMALHVSPRSGPGDALRSVKEQLRGIPDNGIGYGILRYLSEDRDVIAALRGLPRPVLSFNYLGQVDNTRFSGPFRLVAESAGANASERMVRSRLVDVVAVVMGRRLEVSWMYSEDLHQRATIRAVADSYLRELRRILRHCV